MTNCQAVLDRLKVFRRPSAEPYLHNCDMNDEGYIISGRRFIIGLYRSYKNGQ